MLNTYIKNRGITKTIINNNNHNHVNQINWDADYDGDIANISLNTISDGKHNHFDISLNNDDLASILNIPSVNTPIHERLKIDFQKPYHIPEKYYIKVPTYEFESIQPKYFDRHISSPLSGEELIIPLNIDKKNRNLVTFTPHKKHRRTKSHITHRVYKKTKSISKSKSSTKSKSKSKSRSISRKSKSKSIVELF